MDDKREPVAEYRSSIIDHPPTFLTIHRFPMRRLLPLCLLLAACAKKPAVPSTDLVLRNATVYTGDSLAPTATAVAVQGGKIVYVGDEAGVAKYIREGTETIDLAGRFVYPGFVLSLIHI